MNIPLVKALEKTHVYPKFIKDIVKKKKIISFKPADC